MSEGGLLDLLNTIKERWPQLQITKENLLHPTKEIAFKFYSNFMNEYNDKIAYLAQCESSCDYNVADLTPEILFQQLSRLMSRFRTVTFTLLDIYQPVYVRTKNFFRVCIHFITFIDYLTNENDMLGNNMFQVKNETNKFLTELEELLIEIDENTKTKAQLIEYNNNLEHEYKSVKTSHTEMTDLKATREKLYTEKKCQIENLKWELQNEEYELNHLKTREKELQEQRITEDEYQNILRTLGALKTDLETMDNDDVNIGDGLVLENAAVAHSAECNRVLSKYDFNLQNVKTLINREADLKIVSNAMEKLHTNQLTIKQQNLEREKKLLAIKQSFLTLQNEEKKLKENYAHHLAQFSVEHDKLRHDTEVKLQNNIKTISDYNEAITKLEEDLEKLRKAFMNEYVRMSKVEKRVVDKFSATLMKFAKSE